MLGSMGTIVLLFLLLLLATYAAWDFRRMWRLHDKIVKEAPEHDPRFGRDDDDDGQ